MSGTRYGGTIERVLAYVDQLSADDSGCIIWDRGRNQLNGYGRANIRLQDGAWTGVLVHRLVLERSLGRQLVEGEQGLHHCDIPPCVNIDHLFVGSHKDNMADRDAKGRCVIYVSQINEEHALEMRAMFDAGMTLAEVARVKGRDVWTVGQALKRHGLHPGKAAHLGERASNVKLTEVQVIEIKRALADGVATRELARRYSRPLATIEAIKYGRSWKWLA